MPRSGHISRLEPFAKQQPIGQCLNALGIVTMSSWKPFVVPHIVRQKMVRSRSNYRALARTDKPR